MSGVHQILVSVRARRLAAAASLALLAACGQKGPLNLPTGEAAVGRASLPDTLSPAPAPADSGGTTAIVPSVAASSLPPTGTASPVHTQ